MLATITLAIGAAFAFIATKLANMPNSGSWFKYIASLPNSMPLWPAKPKWTVENDMPDLTGKVCLVTGGNGGIGFETCKALYGHNATVYLACRDVTKANTAIQQIREAAKASVGKLDVIELDLADVRSVERAVKAFEAKEQRLDILYCNAGVMASPKGMKTVQGYKLQLGTNSIGHAHLVSLLLPLLLATRKTTGVPSRVITTSSFGHISAISGGIDYDNYAKPIEERTEYSPFTEYGISKWANIAMARYLDIEYGRKGELISVPVHPGMIASELGRHQAGYERIKDYVMPVVTWPTPLGAVSQLYAGTCDLETARKISGEYIVPWAQVGVMRPDLQDDEACRKAWTWMEAEGRRS